MAKVKTDRKLALEDKLTDKKKEDLWEFDDVEQLLAENESNNVKLLKEKLRKAESESVEKDRLLNKQRKQLDDSLRALEEKEKMTHEAQILIKTMEANLHQLEGERRQYLGKIEEYGREIADLQDKCALCEEDIKNLTGQLKSRTQENICLNKENKDLLRLNNQLRESGALLDEKIKEFERELTKAGPARADLDKKYNRALDSLRQEVKAKHQEIVTLGKNVADLKKTQQELQRINENLELELDMLNTTNISLQKKIEKLTLQNSVLEKKLQNRLVRLCLAVCGFLGWNPDRKIKSMGI